MDTTTTTSNNTRWEADTRSAQLAAQDGDYEVAANWHRRAWHLARGLAAAGAGRGWGDRERSSHSDYLHAIEMARAVRDR